MSLTVIYARINITPFGNCRFVLNCRIGIQPGVRLLMEIDFQLESAFKILSA